MTTEIATLRGQLERAMPKLAEVAPKYMRVERIVRIMLSIVSRNPKLAECTPESILTFCMRCAETGLEPIGAGGAWPVPYQNKKTNRTEMQFIPDYRGLVHGAREAELIKGAKAEVVREADDFRYQLGLNPDLTHIPATGKRGEIVAAYCVITDMDGDKSFVVMDIEEIEGIRGRSRAANAGPWATDYGEMVKKTVIRRALKPYAGANVHFDAAIEADNAATGINEQRAPIAKTVAAEDAHAEPPLYEEASQTAPVDAGGHETANEGQDSGGAVAVAVGRVMDKSGSKGGKGWKRYFFQCPDDQEWYSTFDHKIGEALKELENTTAMLIVEKGPNGFDVKGIAGDAAE